MLTPNHYRRVEITCTRIALSSGQGVKLGKRFDVCTGEEILDAVEMTKLADALSAVRHGRETRSRSNESRMMGKSMARDT